MEIRPIFLSDKAQLDLLIQKIESSLSNKEYWLPIDSISKQHFFDIEWTHFYGIFKDNYLIGAVGLFFHPHEFEESAKQLELNNEKVVELGRLMVLPEYRNQGIAKKLINFALKECPSYDILLATVHPENFASKSALLNCGFSYVKTYVKSCGYLRDIVVKKS